MSLLEALIQSVFGTAGAAQAIGVNVATLATPPAGRYTVWAMGRHTSDDGLRLVVGGTVKAVLSAPANTSVRLDKMTVDVDGTQDINIALNIATGIGNAGATLFAMRQCDHLRTHSC